MIQLFTLLSASIVILFTFYSNVFSQDLTPEQIYEKVNDCVVVILSYDFDGKLSKQGSGVVISDKGWVVTNYHVFAECDKVEIKHREKTIKHSDILGADIENDILILKIDKNIFPSISLANSDSLKVGQSVFSIGSPLGMENSISEGLISGLRNVTKKNKNLIQITASISPGSSGGAVVNAKGELIGISTSSLEGGQNLNFSIPVNDLLKVSKSFLNSEKNTVSNNFFYRGYNALKGFKLEICVGLLTSYIDMYPDNYKAYIYRGNAYYRLNEYYNSLTDYTKAIDIDSAIVDAYEGRSVVNFILKEYSKVLSDYNKLIEIDQSNSQYFSQRGFLYNNILNESSKAISDFNRAIQISPTLGEYTLRAEAYSYLHQYPEAISDYTYCIDFFQSKYSYLYRGLEYIKLLDYEKACEDFNKAFYWGETYSTNQNNIILKLGYDLLLKSARENLLKYCK